MPMISTVVEFQIIISYTVIELCFGSEADFRINERTILICFTLGFYPSPKTSLLSELESCSHTFYTGFSRP